MGRGNLLTPEDWDRLADTKLRDFKAVEFAQMRDASKAHLEMIAEAVEVERNVVTAEAVKVANMFWSLVRGGRLEYGEPSFYGTRARRTADGFEIAWFRNRVYGPADDRSVSSTHLKKGKKDAFPLSAFKGAQDWELEAIGLAEQRNALLRKRWSKLTTIRKAIREYRELIAELEELDPKE